MDQVNDYYLELLNYLSTMGLDKELLSTIALVVSLFSVLICLVSYRRVRSYTGAANPARLADKIEHYRIQVGEVSASSQGDVARLSKEVLFLRERVVRLEDKILDQEELAEIKGKEQAISSTSDSINVKKKDIKPHSSVVVNTNTVVRDDVTSPSPERSSGIISGLRKTRELFFGRLRDIIGSKTSLSPEIFSALEELLISSDLGVKTAQKLLTQLKQEQEKIGILDEAALKVFLKNHILSILSSDTSAEIVPERVEGKPLVVVVVGVNGVGKTTTIGKIASRFSSQGAKVLLGACDTFRAAAVEQIKVWAERASVDIISGAEGKKPSTVAYETIHAAQSGDYDVVIIDTAGRLHTRVNLMNELSHVLGIVEREQPGAPHETLLVLDASTGQNALSQAREFHQRVPLTGLIITKLDGTPKGGIVVAIKDELGIPIRYIGVGEGVNDLRPFRASEFVDALFESNSEVSSFVADENKGSLRAVRKRR